MNLFGKRKDSLTYIINLILWDRERPLVEINFNFLKDFLSIFLSNFLSFFFLYENFSLLPFFLHLFNFVVSYLLLPLLLFSFSLGNLLHVKLFLSKSNIPIFYYNFPKILLAYHLNLYPTSTRILQPQHSPNQFSKPYSQDISPLSHPDKLMAILIKFPLLKIIFL